MIIRSESFVRYVHPNECASWLPAVQSVFTPRPPSRSVRNFSLLRIVSLASLFVSARSQLFPATLELSSLDGTSGFTLNGEKAGDNSGVSVSGAGDVNGDGVADLLIGAYTADPAISRELAGRSYVVFGAPNLGAEGTLELSSLNGTNGFVLNGEKKGDGSGQSVSSAGDVNGDGVADLLIGAPGASPVIGGFGAGKTYVVFGRRGLGAGGTLELASLNGTNGFTLNGVAAGDRSGFSVSTAGDMNGDRVADLLIGAKGASPAAGRTYAGQSYVVFGKRDLGSGGTVELSTLNGTRGFFLDGERIGDVSGRSVSSAGDVNGDGISDLVIGAYGALDSAGKSYVVDPAQGLAEPIFPRENS